MEIQDGRPGGLVRQVDVQRHLADAGEGATGVKCPDVLAGVQRVHPQVVYGLKPRY